MDSASDRDERAGVAFGRRDAVRAAFRRWRATIALPPRARWRRLGRDWLADQLAAETRARTGFLLVPLGLMIGVALVHGAGWVPNVWLTILAAIASLCLALRRVGRPVLHPMLILAGFTLVGTALAIGEIQRTETTILSGQATVRIAGRVVSRERTEDGRYRYVIAVAETERPVLSRPPERVRIVVGSRHEPIAPGGLYRGLVRLGPPSGPAFPGSYDFAMAPFFAGIGAYGYSLGAPEAEPTPPAASDDGGGILAELRHVQTQTRLALTERISTVIGGREGAIAAALITGERAGIPDDAREWLRGTGLAHVLSISGLHMAIVAGFAMLAVRSSLSLVPAISLRLPAKKIASIVALVVAAIYLAISGANVATQRSFVMLAIMLGAVLIDRPALTLRNVAIAAIVVILVAPHAAMTASFQMSFAATVALIGGYAALSQWRAGRERGRETHRGVAGKILVALSAIMVTSLLAGSATAPYAAYHFHRMAAFGFVANLLTMPLFTLWIMPLALVGTLLIPFGLDAWPFQAMGAGLWLVLEIARNVYAWLPDQAIGRMTALGLLLLTASILTASCLASRLRWLGLPLALAGFIAAPDRTAPPELLIFEDGKEVATLAADGQLAFLRAKPSGFIAEQWERAFEARAPRGTDTERIRTTIPAECAAKYCRFTTRGGLRVVWTEDYARTGDACDEADVAIVSRAIRLTECRSGAALVTLRTLRRTGSLAIGREAATGRPRIEQAVRDPPERWNVHRLAPWPEYWRKPAAPDPPAPVTQPASATVSNGGTASAGRTATVGP
ncbi:ComEC/Rec2 family competence protein [Aurantimonas coralicida]|uniref:ComEC/Rec2 family competence protein n=1 Tax=Aurantimonas coralicida TaxID=182270 RepID=UPI001D18875D|nr:ComEC/Rec2 family competence protein [Aurantimonas coralicida]MCC4298633.1 ComEC family competence protein [Aurantimonas coralicida]